MATASVSLIREQSEAVRPPRALWVPFALGRPLGSADDPDFQKDVIRACLGMLATAREPTIEDYPIEAPEEAAAEQWVCPVNFRVPDDDSLTARLVAEVTRLAPWAAETRATRGRTSFGVSGVTPDQVEHLARALGGVADGGDVVGVQDEPDVAWNFSMPFLLRHMADDMRTFYHEAIAAQPGPGAPNHDALNAWLFGDAAAGRAGTALGDTLVAIAEHLTEDDRLESLFVRGWMIPEGYFRGGSAFPSQERIAKGDSRT